MNQNSFAQNVAELTNNANIAIASLNAVTESIIGDDASVIVDLPNDTSVTIISNNNILHRLSAVEDTVKAFTSGQGSVKLVDGTNRKIQVTTIPITPEKIENIDQITNFNINNNWFFEDLMFPKMTVTFNLKGKVDDDSDRIKMNRVIIDLSNNKGEILNFYNEYINGKKLSYAGLIDLLNSNDILSYYEDDQIIDFPLYEDEYVGKFNVLNKEIIDGNLYYYLDSIYYGMNNKYDQNVSNNIKLKIGDKLRFQQSIYVIKNIDEASNRIDLKCEIGFDIIGLNDDLYFYNEPFKSKNINIAIGINEINCIFFKAVNENYNIVSNNWSDMTSFVSNDLILENNNITLEEYYMQYVSDFGAEWIAQAKERKVSAYNGLIPNTVNLVANDFKVVQINTQINSALDTTEIKNVQAQIVTLKSNIKTLRNTISKQKADLTNSTDQKDRTYLQELIATNTNKLDSIVTEYNSNVEYLNTYLIENKAATNSPKYRVRGFFAIPEYQYKDPINKLGKQEIIGFDIKYRYLKMDETGVPLTTFEYTNSNSNKVSAVFSDWNIVKSIYKEKKLNEESGIYEWVVENDADGTQININQVDIPISDGEKVEFMVRAVSEAGYPENPLKSEWSNSVVIEFPSNLSTTDQLVNILNDAKSESISIKLEDTLKSSGYYTHINDEVISPIDNTVMYHHDAKNISFRYINNSDSSNNIISTVNLYDYIMILEDRIAKLENKIDSK